MSRARLKLAELAMFERDVFEIAAPIQSPAKFEVSKSTIYEAVTEKLEYRKLCASSVPKMLTDDHKTKRMGPALKFLTRYAQEGDKFLDSIVTGDKTWGFHHTPGSNQQSLQVRRR